MRHGPLLQTSIVTVGALLLLLVCGVRAATEDHELARRLRKDGSIVALATIRRAALQIIPGRILDVEFQQDGDRWAYLLELVDAYGVVWYLLYDARSGSLLHMKKDKRR